MYSRHDGHTSLVTIGAPDTCTLPSTRCEPIWHGASADGRRAWIEAVPGVVSGSLGVSDPYDDLFGATVHVSGLAAGDALTYSGSIPGSLNSGATR